MLLSTLVAKEQLVKFPTKAYFYGNFDVNMVDQDGTTAYVEAMFAPDLIDRRTKVNIPNERKYRIIVVGFQANGSGFKLIPGALPPTINQFIIMLHSTNMQDLMNCAADTYA